MVFFYSCGNKILDFTKNTDSPGGNVNAGFLSAWDSGSSSYVAVPAASEAYAGGIADYAKEEINKVYVYAAQNTSQSSSDTSTSESASIDARISVNNGKAVAGGIAGNMGTNRNIANTYAYISMKSQSGGSPFAGASNANNKHGADISVANAKLLAFYTNTLSWSSGVWGYGSPYPILTSLALPLYTDWAQIP